ncbi:MAG TPA: hypothetical protein VNT29_04135, partial [Candidatus Limnocylindrales bacterium]|nr:hypothetical protein [Candidatus Limnocylindrales bacterium]
TPDTIGGRPAGKGLADYSNLNFVTQDTNYNDEDPNWRCQGAPFPPLRKCLYYDFPKISEATPREEIVEERVRDGFGYRTELVIEQVYTLPLRDNVTGNVENDPFHTFLSSIDLELREGGCGPVYSLADNSYYSRASFLIPRAVAYSKGIVEHFFRGRVEVRWEPIPNVQGVYNVVIINRSDERIQGDMSIALAYRADPSYFNGGSDLMFVLDGNVSDFVGPFLGIDPGDSVTIPSVSVPGLHPGDDINAFERRAVVAGTLGTESLSVIGQIDSATALRVHVDAFPNLVKWSVLCSWGVFSPSAQNPNEITVALDKPGECRALIQHTEQAQVGNEGTPVFLNLRVFKNSATVEDLTAVIDASDAAVGGCHSAGVSRPCDRFIQRVGNCVTQPNSTQPKCTVTIEPWSR